jgi:hypothetical protein
MVDLYWAQSIDGGTTFGPPLRVSEVTTDWGATATNLVPNFGDYNTAVSDGNRVFATWADGRNGVPDTYFAKILTRGNAPSAPSESLVSVELNDRNAYEKGAAGMALIDPFAEGGIIEEVSLQASKLLPNHQYTVWRVVQDAGNFDPILTISPNFFQSTVTTNQQGSFSIQGTFPGPAAALEPGLYRVDIFVTYTDETPILDAPEANLIREASLYGTGTQYLEGYDLLLSSSPFSTGIEVTVP